MIQDDDIHEKWRRGIIRTSLQIVQGVEAYRSSIEYFDIYYPTPQEGLNMKIWHRKLLVIVKQKMFLYLKG